MTSPTSAPAVISAWQLALAAEYAAVFGYGALGPHLSDPAQATKAGAVEQVHRELTFTVMDELLAAGQQPDPPLATYPLPWPLIDAPSALRLALRLEESAAAAWRYVVSTATLAVAGPDLSAAQRDSLRQHAIGRLSDSAVRAVGWRRIVTPSDPSVPFPGT